MSTEPINQSYKASFRGISTDGKQFCGEQAIESSSITGALQKVISGIRKQNPNGRVVSVLVEENNEPAYQFLPREK